MTYKTDQEIKREVERELRWDTHVEEAEIGVTVHNGVVTLVGVVSSYAKKLAAQEAAHRVGEVLDVANELQIKVPASRMRDDTEIAQAVRHALEWNVFVPDERIRSTVTNGWVMLEGNVDKLVERQDAERAIRHLAGVHGVLNRLVVIGQPIEPEEVRAIIEEALQRRAGREANRINVSVYQGAVTLSGSVSTWAEKRAITGAVSHAPGVHMVHDHLHLDLKQLAAGA